MAVRSGPMTKIGVTRIILRTLRSLPVTPRQCKLWMHNSVAVCRCTCKCMLVVGNLLTSR